MTVWSVSVGSHWWSIKCAVSVQCGQRVVSGWSSQSLVSGGQSSVQRVYSVVSEWSVGEAARHWSVVVNQVFRECTVWSATGQWVEQPDTGQWWSVKCSESVQCGQRVVSGCSSQTLVSGGQSSVQRVYTVVCEWSVGGAASHWSVVVSQVFRECTLWSASGQSVE